MTEWATEREQILAGLSDRVRTSLDDAEALSHVLDSLTEEERKAVLAVINMLIELDGRSPSLETGPQAEPLEVPQDSMERVEANVKFIPSAVVMPAAFQLPGEPEIVAPDELVELGERSEAGVIYPVWFGTMRRMDGTGFGGDREESGRMTYGVARVHVPQAHRLASLGSSWWWRWLWNWPDDRLRLQRLEARSEEGFFKEIRDTLAAFTQERFDQEGSSLEGQVLLYVHGYNVSFYDAILRAAQLGNDLRIPGLTACFDWASKGTYAGYLADSASVESSVAALVDFIQALVEQTGAGKVHILAHSMGNRAVLRALEHVAWALRTRVEVGQILLAAPDVDQDVLRLQAPACLKATRKQTTLYMCRRDRAVEASAWLHSFPRAGYLPPPVVLKGLTTIDATPIAGKGFISHGYYAESDRMLEDMRALIHFNSPLSSRALNACNYEGKEYWSFF